MATINHIRVGTINASTLVFLASLSVAAPTVAQEDRCAALLTMGLYDETETTSSSIEERRLYKFVCEQQSSRRSESENRSANASYELFSVGAKRGKSSMAEYYESFCGSAEDEVFDSQDLNSRARQINANVVDAWRQCIATEQLGVRLQPRVLTEETTISFAIEYDDSRLTEEAFLRGVRSDTFTCKVGLQDGTAVTDSEISESGVNGQAIQLKENSTNLHCTREGFNSEINGRPYTHYAADSLMLDLTTGAFAMDFVERREGPVVEEFKDLQERFRQLAARNQELTATLGDVQSRMEVVDSRFGKLKLMLTSRRRLDSDCDTELNDSSSAPNCPEGWIDSNTTFTEAWVGGKCGLGTHYRLCIRADE